jgi:hypothetical protein
MDIGASLVVETQHGGTWFPRFVGTVTDVGLTWDVGRGTYGAEPDVVPRGQVMGAGALAGTGRRYIGDVPWPQESDGARAGRILAAAAATVGQVDPGTVQLLPRDVDRKAALELLGDTANDGGGVVWESADGLLNYADADHRRNTPPAATLDACDVLMAPHWSKTAAGLVNDVAVAYGIPPDGGDQPVVTTTNAASIAAYGRYAYSVTTELAALADAQARAQTLTVRGGYPAWNVTDLPLDLSVLDDALTDLVLGLEVHDLLQLVGQPAGTPSPGAVNSLWIEGWTERLTYGGHELTFSVSAYCRTVPPPRWNDVSPSQTWDSTLPSATWDSASCLGPQPSLGRWDDTAASLRWDEVPAATTWDTWKG